VKLSKLWALFLKVLFESDTAYLILMALFSLTNGYLGNVCMTFGPKMLTTGAEQGQVTDHFQFHPRGGATILEEIVG
jgi:hypothetical protein